MSHASAKLAPIPTAGPFIAAITGLGIVRRRVSIGMYSLRSTLPASSGVRMPPPCAISVTSAPEQNARPHPVKTTTRTASSRSTCLIASPSCFRVSAPIAFIFSGRFSCINPTPSWVRTTTCCSTSVVAMSLYLPTLEYALPFLQERVHAFFLVFGREQEVKALALDGQPFRERRLERLEDRLLRHPERKRRLLGELAGGSLCDVDRHVGRHDLVHQAHLVGAPGADGGARQHHLPAHVLPDRARPALGAAGARDDAEVDLRLPESSRVAGNDQVAHQGHFAAASGAAAVHSANTGFAEGGDPRPGAGLG